MAPDRPFFTVLAGIFLTQCLEPAQSLSVPWAVIPLDKNEMSAKVTRQNYECLKLVLKGIFQKGKKKEFKNILNKESDIFEIIKELSRLISLEFCSILILKRPILILRR